MVYGFRRLLALAVLMVLWCGACASGRTPADVSAGQSGRRLRVLTYNIHHGEGVDRKLDLARVARVIAAQEPDLVALQEVDVKTRRAGGVDQAAELAKLTGMRVAFGRTIDYDGGQYGNAVLSRVSIESSEVRRLPGSASGERRGALAVVVRPWEKGPAVTFVATHFDHRQELDRLRQAQEINRLFAKDGCRPVLLAGDLNAEPASDPVAVLAEQWKDVAAGVRGDDAVPGATWPAEKPRKRIDYVMFRPAGAWRVVEARVVDEAVASDHRPVLAVVEWQGGARP